MKPPGFTTVNPATEQEIEAFAYYDSARTEDALARADRGFQSFRKSSVHARSRLLSQLARKLRENKARLAKIITTEMGKILAEAEAEIESARTKLTGMPSTDHKCLQTHPLRRAKSTPTFPICHWAPFSPSCRGISRFGS